MTEREDGLAAAGKSLREWRDGEELTQAAAADLISASQGAWAAWEKGRKAPDLVFAVAIERLSKGVVKAEVWAVARPASRIARAFAAAEAEADESGGRAALTDDDIKRAVGG